MNTGKIIAYSEEAAAGVIKDDDGGKYFFTSTEWRMHYQPEWGLKVTFQPGSGFALKIRTAA